MPLLFRYVKLYIQRYDFKSLQIYIYTCIWPTVRILCQKDQNKNGILFVGFQSFIMGVY